MKVEPTIIKDGELAYYVFYQDARNVSRIVKKKIQLILTSPPYVYCKDYSALTKSRALFIPKMTDDTYKKYISFLGKVLKECTNVLAKTGVLLLVVDFLSRDDGCVLPLPLDLINRCSKLGLKCKDVWLYRKIGTKTLEAEKILKNSHEFMLMFTKSNSFKCNLEKAEAAEGKPISSLWEFELKIESKYRNLLFCPFPDSLVDRAIRLFTDEGDWVMDPFLGSGKVVARARALRRNAVGFEINSSLKPIIEETICAAKPSF